MMFGRSKYGLGPAGGSIWLAQTIISEQEFKMTICNGHKRGEEMGRVHRRGWKGVP